VDDAQLAAALDGPAAAGRAGRRRGQHQLVARNYPRAHLVAASADPHGLGWRVRLSERDGAHEVLVDEAGAVLAESAVVPAREAPAVVRRAVARQFGAASVWRTERLVGADAEVWRVTFATRDRVGEALVSPEGRLIQASFDVA
jgi:hypothetical protein